VKKHNAYYAVDFLVIRQQVVYENRDEFVVEDNEDDDSNDDIEDDDTDTTPKLSKRKVVAQRSTVSSEL